ncbi:MAG: metallophosphoesterase, partial [Verrucomicrobiota bacterium]
MTLLPTQRLIALLVTTLFLALVPEGLAALTVKRGPYLQKGSPTAISVLWRTSNSSTSVVRYGTSRSNLDQVASLSTEVKDHAVRLTGLQPDTVYYYSIESVDGGEKVVVSEDHFSFRTAPVVGTRKPLRFWVLGDSGTADRRAVAVRDSFRRYNGDQPLDFWLMLGDNAYPDGTDSEYQEAVFDFYPEELNTSVVWPTLGNHDEHNEDVYLKVFDLPTNGESGGLRSGTEYYYSFDYANIHFICLDSSTHYKESLGEGMFAWLEDDLASTNQEWIICFFHHPPYSKGSHDSDAEKALYSMREKAVPLLESYGADLILSGHSHSYERSMFMDGHYGKSSSFDPSTHAIDPGNGSDLGSVDSEGDFHYTGGTGAYQKLPTASNNGLVAAVCGTSGKVSSWDNGSDKIVNPKPHAAMKVSLKALGSMLIEVDGSNLNAKLIGVEADIRDDFTISKGSAINVVRVESTPPIFQLERTEPYDEAITVSYRASDTKDQTVFVTGEATLADGQAKQRFTVDAFSAQDEVTVTLVTDGGYRVGDRPAASSQPDTPAGNIAPLVTLRSPGPGDRRFYEGLPMQLRADVLDRDGEGKRVDFFVNGAGAGSVLADPFVLDWTPPSEGTFVITAAAFDNDGARSTLSKPWTVVVEDADDAWIESDGLIVFEAEDYDFRSNRSGHSWIESTQQSGYTADAALYASPNDRGNSINYDQGLVIPCEGSVSPHHDTRRRANSSCSVNDLYT